MKNPVLSHSREKPTSIFQKLYVRLTQSHPFASAIAVGLGAWLLSFFFYCIPLWMVVLGDHSSHTRLDDFIRLCQNPLNRDIGETILIYRPTTPMLAWVLGLRGESGLLLQYLAIPATLALVFHALKSKTDTAIALWTTVGISLTYTVIWSNVHPGFPDSVTHLCCAILLLTRHPLAAISLTVFGTLNDERFILSLPFILLWHADLSCAKKTCVSLFKLTLPHLLALAVVYAVRYAIAEGYIGEKIAYPEVYQELAKLNANESTPLRNCVINILVGWRLMWILPLWFLLKPSKQENWLVSVTVVFSLVAAVFISCMVYDVARSMGFAFMALVFAAWRLHASPKLLPVLKVSVMLMLFTPCFYFMEANLQLERPFVLSLVRALTGWDVTHLLR